MAYEADPNLFLAKLENPRKAEIYDELIKISMNDDELENVRREEKIRNLYGGYESEYEAYLRWRWPEKQEPIKWFLTMIPNEPIARMVIEELRARRFQTVDSILGVQAVSVPMALAYYQRWKEEYCCFLLRGNGNNNSNVKNEDFFNNSINQQLVSRTIEQDQIEMKERVLANCSSISDYLKQKFSTADPNLIGELICIHAQNKIEALEAYHIFVSVEVIRKGRNLLGNSVQTRGRARSKSALRKRNGRSKTPGRRVAFSGKDDVKLITPLSSSVDNIQKMISSPTAVEDMEPRRSIDDRPQSSENSFILAIRYFNDEAGKYTNGGGAKTKKQIETQFSVSIYIARDNIITIRGDETNVRNTVLHIWTLWSERLNHIFITEELREFEIPKISQFDRVKFMCENDIFYEIQPGERKVIIKSWDKKKLYKALYKLY